MRRALPSQVLLAIGLGELAAGAALVVVPRQFLALLDVPLAAGPAAIWLRWIGVFVAAVGALYFLPWWGPRRLAKARLRFSLEATSMIRLLVAGFIAVSILGGALPTEWALVGGYDAVVGGSQLALLVLGFFAEGED